MNIIDNIKKNLILKITSVFENNTPDLQYDYIEALGDGRGYTFGYCGFTTGTGDGLLVILELQHNLASDNLALRRPAEAFHQYIDRLKFLAKNEDGSIDGLEGFDARWKTHGASKPVIDAQLTIGDQLYWTRALRIWNELGWKTALGLACLYDAIIQHGEGEDPDSIGAMLKRANPTERETESICRFLTVRQATLEYATDPDTREEWANSVARVEALFNLVNTGNWNLDLPVEIRSKDFNHILR